MAGLDKHWFLTNVSAPRAWDMVFRGGPYDLARPAWDKIAAFDWRDVRVGHLDHGYTGHPATKAVVQPAKGLNCLEPNKPDPRDPMDYPEGLGVHGHCTRTGSVLAGIDRDAGYLGVAPGVPLIPYRVSNRSVMNAPGNSLAEAETTHVAQAIRDAIARNGCQVISISLGSVFGAPDMGKAVDEAYEAGVIVVAAAGQVLGKIVYPGKYRQTISVGGTEPGNRPYFTYGGNNQPDIWAPGKAVWRANSELPDDGKQRYGYDFGEGTSYATAVVAGLAALFVRHFATELKQKGYVGWHRVELFRWLLANRGNSLAGGHDGKYVQFPGVLRETFDWPKANTLKHAEGKAALTVH